MPRTIDPRIGYLDYHGEHVKAVVTSELAEAKHDDKGWRIFQDQSQSVILKFRVQRKDWREKVVPRAVATSAEARIRAFVQCAVKKAFAD